MPVEFYIIPMAAGPYSRTNPQRPDFVDEIRCNWVGHNIDALGVYICKVNTTDAKHTDLASRTGVRQLPRGYTLSTVISTLPLAARNVISNWLSGKGLPYYTDETIGQLLMRIISSGVLNTGGLDRATVISTAGQAVKDNIANCCAKWRIDYSENETLQSIMNKTGPIFWNPNSVSVAEF